MKKYYIIFVLAVFLITLGTIITFTEVLDFKVADIYQGSTVKEKTAIYYFDATEDDTIIEPIYEEAKNTTTFDNDIKEGTFKVVVTYYEGLYKITKDVRTANDVQFISYNFGEDLNNHELKNWFDVTIEGLKDKTVYNFEEAFAPSLELIINEKDKGNITISEY